MGMRKLKREVVRKTMEKYRLRRVNKDTPNGSFFSNNWRSYLSQTKAKFKKQRLES